MTISGYTVFKFHRVVELHFTTEHYNLFKYKGKVRGATISDFDKNSHKEFYNSFSHNFKERDELLDYFAANFAYQNMKGFIFNKESNSFGYRNEWVRRKQNITGVFENDLKNIMEEYKKEDGSVGVFIERTKTPVLLDLFFQ